jgi:HAD superfamily phosphoserine phosphatase-like hydrolase
MLRNLVIFDFCETLVDIQSADRFVGYTLLKSGSRVRIFYYRHFMVFLRRIYLFALLGKIFPKGNCEKRFVLFSLAGLKLSFIEDCGKSFFETVLLDTYNKRVIDRLHEHKRQQDIILISSGGYDVYLNYFCDSQEIEFLNSTQIGSVFGLCSGTIKGRDCMFEEKVRQVKDLVIRNNLVYASCIAYSDSFSDLPLLSWADKAFVVSKSYRTWINSNKFEWFKPG